MRSARTSAPAERRSRPQLSTDSSPRPANGVSMCRTMSVDLQSGSTFRSSSTTPRLSRGSIEQVPIACPLITPATTASRSCDDASSAGYAAPSRADANGSVFESRSRANSSAASAIFLSACDEGVDPSAGTCSTHRVDAKIALDRLEEVPPHLRSVCGRSRARMDA